MSKDIIKAPKIPIGYDDFAAMRTLKVDLENNPATIADKTRFLPYLLIGPNHVTLFTRPIRFMKSSTFSMMARFLSIKDAEANKLLFDDLDISDKKYDSFRESYQGKFPIIHLTFKRINFETWGKAKKSIGKLIALLYDEYSFIQPSLNQREQAKYQRIMNNESEYAELEKSLSQMITYLYKYYKKKVIILIDEYDTPLNSAYKYTKKEDRDQHGSYFQSMISFMAVFLQDALKGHPHLEKGFMTGVSYLAFSSLSSSLNNTNSCSIFTPEFAEIFGFTEDEVESFINQVKGIDEKQRKKLREVIQSWYNGYYIGDESVRIYNPWSVGNFFNSLPKNLDMSGEPYWLEVGDSIGIFEHLAPRFESIQSDIANLMLNKKVTVEADKRMRVLDLDDANNHKVFWSLLLHSGYLSASNIQRTSETITCDVAIPNYEIQSAYAYLIRRYQNKYDPNSKCANAITRALLDGNISEFANNLEMFMDQVVSFYDLPKSKKLDKKIREQVYHAFVLGILAGMLSHYEISSNREAGHGRCDIILAPREKGKHGIIFELKSTEDKASLKKSAKEALGQITKMSYSTALETKKVPKGLHIGMSFYGKHFHMEYEKVSYELERVAINSDAVTVDV